MLTSLGVLTVVGVAVMVGLERGLLIVPPTLNTAGAVAASWMTPDVLFECPYDSDEQEPNWDRAHDLTERRSGRAVRGSRHSQRRSSRRF